MSATGDACFHFSATVQVEELITKFYENGFYGWLSQSRDINNVHFPVDSMVKPWLSPCFFGISKPWITNKWINFRGIGKTYVKTDEA